MATTLSTAPATARPARARWAPALVDVLWLAALMLGADAAVFALTGEGAASRAVWLSPGIALAVLIARGLDRWPAIPISAFALAFGFTHSVAIGMAAAAGATAQVLAAFGVLRWRKFALPGASVRCTTDLILSGGLLLPVVGASVGIGFMALSGALEGSSLASAWVSWLTGAGAGAVVTAPLILGLISFPRHGWTRARALEAAALTAALALVALTAYGGMVEIGEGEGLAALAFPFVIWAALRFGMSGAALVSLAVTLMVIWGTSRSPDVVSGISSPLGTFYRDFLCATLSGSGVLLAAVFEEGRRNATALESSERNYRRLTEEASDAILLTMGGEGRIVGGNARASELLGYTREELHALRVIDLIPHLERTSSPPREVPAGAAPILFERNMLRKDGQIVPVEVSARRLEDGRVQGILRDISERRRAEIELRETFSMLQATLDSTTDGILVVDEHGKMRGFNRRFIELWRIPEAIIESRDDDRAVEFVCDQLKDPEGFRSQVRYMYEHAQETSFDVLEFKDGRVYERYSRPQLVAGLPKGRVWSFRDVTQHRLLEGQLRQAQKMEAVGSLAGGVAHDFNNLLTAIMGHSSLMLAEMDDAHPLRDEVTEIHRATERAALLTRQLLTFSRQQMVEPKILDLNSVVLPMQKMLARTLGETIEIVLKPAPDPLTVWADIGHIEQLLLNLAINARDAMPEGGLLTIETSAVRLTEKAVALGLEPGEFVRLSVIDTGVGMDEDTRSRIFEPFFTTKERGRGTGLGLSTVYGIMRQSGGAIEVDSAPGRGTLFDLYFPRAHAEAGPPEADTPPAAMRPGHGTVLLVEDEPSVRGLLEEAVRNVGFEVIAASHAREALKRVEGHPGRIDILVTDVVMPGMSGPDLARQLTGSCPDLRVLFISGYTADELGPRVPLESGQSFLQKPFSPATLIRKIQDVLEAPVG